MKSFAFKNNKENYLQEFDSEKNGPIHQQEFVNTEIKEYYDKINQIKQFYCENFTEMWPTNLDYCKQCKQNPIKFSKVYIT